MSNTPLHQSKLFKLSMTNYQEREELVKVYEMFIFEKTPKSGE